MRDGTTAVRSRRPVAICALEVRHYALNAALGWHACPQVVALVEPKQLTVAHVGDSRGVLCRAGGETVAITQDHKPELEAERKRIESLGGFVSYIGCWRAMGILAMSRAIGDLFLKPYVSPEPDVATFTLDDTDEFVVLASDGVFDVFDNEQVVKIVGSAASPQEAANLLTHSAFVAGSLDNVTAVVVALRGYRRGAPARSPAEPIGRGSLRSAMAAAWSDAWSDADHGQPVPTGGSGTRSAVGGAHDADR